jgi:hypothetical protein
MPTPAQQQNNAQALAQIRSAEQALDNVIATTANPDTLNTLAGIYSQLTSVATSLIQAQTTADDGVFTQMAVSLNGQAKSLKASQALIQHLITDAATAGKIIGYLTQAAAFIARL